MIMMTRDIKDISNDIFIGVIIAFVSIPISMGYAMIAGLPAVYGLYGSVLPVFFFACISSSPRFVFGVDAAPAAIVGSMLTSLGIAGQSEEAIRIVPVITVVTALWLLLFALLKADRLTRFVSSPVMGGFISGIGIEIILMQSPKLFGGNAIHGELTELIPAIINSAAKDFNILSFILGITTIAIILFFKKKAPRIPMTVILMLAGALLTVFTPIKDAGVRIMEAPAKSFIPFALPDLSILGGEEAFQIMITSFTIALVVTAETLLATRNIGIKHGDKIDGGREIFAYTAAMAAAAVSGCCPVNGSISRTGIADQYKVKSRIMSFTASAVMILILLFGTPLIGYLPVPILTGIVVSALMGIIEADLAKKLYHVDRTEFIIFMAVLFSVLLFGTMSGVAAGVALSFITYIIRASKPAKSFLGCIPGQEGFYPADRYHGVKTIKGAVIYRFLAPLFFANIQDFMKDIENALSGEKGKEIKTVIIDAGNISSIDMTAADHLLRMYESLKARGIKLFITEHRGKLNDELHEFGCGIMLSEWAALPRIENALRSCGIKEPYEFDDELPSYCIQDGISTEGKGTSAPQLSVAVWEDFRSSKDIHPREDRKVLALFEWAFGKDAQNHLNELFPDEEE